MQTKNDTEEYLLKLLMENKNANIDDILSHKWFIFGSSDDTLWLKCNECEFYYSVSRFYNGSVIRFFADDALAKETLPIMNCKACKMHSAIS